MKLRASRRKQNWRVPTERKPWIWKLLQWRAERNRRAAALSAVKAISDESDFVMPPMDEFIAEDGAFRTESFVLFAALRPWLWGK